MAFLATYGWELLFGLISAGALAFCKYLWKQNKELKDYKKTDQNQQYRQMILSEIEPITDELSKLHGEIKQVQVYADKEHKHMYEDLSKIQGKNDRNFDLILNSYKFRLIQLCKTYLKDQYITNEEFEQVSEMYKLYSELGGNGQAEDYYHKVMALEIKDV